jgi:hypothetical protein
MAIDNSRPVGYGRVPRPVKSPTVSDSFQKLGDLDATAEQAPGLAARVSAWLVSENIVSGELTDCVLLGLGRRPGPGHGRTLENPDDADGAWTTLWTNGLQVEVARQVYYGGQSGVSDATCPNCRNVEPFSDFTDALNDWFDSGTPDHACPACARRSPINDWIVEPQWGVGHLQLTFWNWPPLSSQFRQEVAAHLNHHRLLYIYDKF